MSLGDFFNLISQFTLLLGAKIFILTLMFFYLVLAGVIWRQIGVMTNVLDVFGFSPILKTVAFIHFLAALVIFFLAIFLL